ASKVLGSNSRRTFSASPWMISQLGRIAVMLSLIGMFLLLSFGLILERGQFRLHIFADDTQRLMVTVAIPSGDAVTHLFGLVAHAMLSERSGRCPHQVEDITVLFNQRTVRFRSLLLVRLIQETTQPVGYIVRQPSAAKLT